MTAAMQVHALGLVPGDTIEGREGYDEEGYGDSLRLTLIGCAGPVAVWGVRHAVGIGDQLEWIEDIDSCHIDLSGRDWRKIASGPAPEEPWRQELREVWLLLHDIYHGVMPHPARVTEWLGRNAGFAPEGPAK
jgi:hypothetical protein